MTGASIKGQVHTPFRRLTFWYSAWLRHDDAGTDDTCHLAADL